MNPNSLAARTWNNVVGIETQNPKSAVCTPSARSFAPKSFVDPLSLFPWLSLRSHCRRSVLGSELTGKPRKPTGSLWAEAERGAMVSGSGQCATVVVVDARHHMLGRLASILAKELLNGQRVVRFENSLSVSFMFSHNFVFCYHFVGLRLFCYVSEGLITRLTRICTGRCPN